MISIASFSKSKDKNSSGVSGVNSATITNKVQGVYLWGKYHDHTANIDGDMTDVGNITADGNITTTGDVSANNVNANNVNATNNVNAVNVNSDTVNTNDIFADIIKADSEIQAELAKLTTIHSTDIHTDELLANDISTQNLEVTGKAHFFELVIDKIKAAGGAVLLTPADGFKTDLVEEAGTFEVDEMIYDDDNDQVFNRGELASSGTGLTQPRFSFSSVIDSADNLLAEFTTTKHNIKYFYSQGPTQLTHIQYENGQQSKNSAGGQSGGYFASPYILCDDIESINIISDGYAGSTSAGVGTKLAAYDENFNYIKENSTGNVNSVHWHKAAGTKWVRFTGRNTITNGKIYINDQREGDITIKYLFTKYPNGRGAQTKYQSTINLNYVKSFKIWRDNTNEKFKQADELVLNAIPVITPDNKGYLYDTISGTLGTFSGENNYVCGEKITGGYSDVYGYRLLFKTNDGDRAIKNMWQVNDQALCQSFNMAEVGQTSEVSNKYYWSLVEKVGTVNKGENEYHFIDISNSVFDGTLNPEVGDEIAMCGYRGTDDNERQSAIYIAAYNSLDPQIKAPLIAQYQGINDFNLSTHRVNTISNGLNSFKGTFTTKTGDDIEQLIDDVGEGATSYIHQAFANSADGQLNFSKTYFNNALYVGFCSNHTESDAALIYSDYTWCRLRGENGTTPEVYTMRSPYQFINVVGTLADMQDFYVRGYKLENDTYVEVNNTVQVIYRYSNRANYNDESTLPYWISPIQMSQDFSEGLNQITFYMLDENDNPISTYNIGIIYDGEKGEDGKDADNYKLVPIIEQVPIDANSVLGINLSYNIVHILGEDYSLVTASEDGFKVRFKVKGSVNEWQQVYNLSYTQTPSYTNTTFQENWKTTRNHVIYITVELVNGDTVFDKRLVYAALTPSASLTITDNITSTVAGHTRTIDGIQNNISQIEQNADSISSRVTSIEGDYVTESEMNQTADEIELSVNNLSLQLDGIRNNIILNGNTIINGSLNLNDTTQGLVLTGLGGVTKFSPESIGTFNQWSAKIRTTRNVEQYEDITPSAGAGNSYQTQTTFEYYYGNQKQGAPVLVDDLLISITGNSPNNISTTIYVYENNVLKRTYTFTGTSFDDNVWDGEWDMTADAALKYKFVITATYSTNTKANVNLKYNINAPTIAMLQIGYDGIGMIYDSGLSVNYFGQEGAVIAYGDYGLKVDNTGLYSWLQDNNHGGWHKIQKEQNVKTISTNYTLGYDDDFIIGKASSGITLTLPYDFPAGKTIYVKNLTGNTFTVSCPNRIILQDDRTPSNSFTTGNRTYFLIWSGEYWIVGYCG